MRSVLCNRKVVKRQGLIYLTQRLSERRVLVLSGMARFTCHDPHNIYDVIPCDLVGSAILVSACALQQVQRL